MEEMRPQFCHYIKQRWRIAVINFFIFFIAPVKKTITIVFLNWWAMGKIKLKSPSLNHINKLFVSCSLYDLAIGRPNSTKHCSDFRSSDLMSD